MTRFVNEDLRTWNYFNLGYGLLPEFVLIQSILRGYVQDRSMKPNTELHSFTQLPQTRVEGSSKRRTTSSHAQRRDGTRSKRDFYGNFDFTSSRPSYSPRNRIPRLVQCRYDPSVPEPEVNSRIPQVLPSGRGLHGKNDQTIKQRLKAPRGIPKIASAVTSMRSAVIQTEDRAVIAPSLGTLGVPSALAGKSPVHLRLDTRYASSY